MKCRKQFKYHKIPITSLWEVHLDEKLWIRLRQAALLHECSLSWITRYCALRLARKKRIRMFPAMEKHSNWVRETQRLAPKTHRHILCLYGDDEKLLRITSMQLGITVSHLIRLALNWFLPKIESGIVDWRHIFYHGTKICLYLDITRKNMRQLPYFDHIFYRKWPIEKWWKRPMPIIPIPYSPGASISNLYTFLQPGEKNPYLKWLLEL